MPSPNQRFGKRSLFIIQYTISSTLYTIYILYLYYLYYLHYLHLYYVSPVPHSLFLCYCDRLFLIEYTFAYIKIRK